ncbi:MAG: metal-dependent hydrolase [Myxococcota bacterium]
MDSVTQAVLGAAIGQAAFRRRLGRRALVFGAIGGTIPDLDIIGSAIDPFAEMWFHRGPTHSLVVIPLIAPIVGWLGHRTLGRRCDADVWVWIQLAFWALITHPLLDVFTSYGTQLLYPVSTQRFALDGVSIIDPIYTVPLMLCVAVGAWSRAPDALRGITALMLALTTGYLFWGTYLSQGVVQRARTTLSAQIGTDVQTAPDGVRAVPLIGTNRGFRVLARTEDRIFIGHTNVRGSPLQFTSIPRRRAAVEAVIDTDRGRLFDWFSDGYWAGTSTTGLIRLSDLRFGSVLRPTQSLWGIEAKTGPDGIQEIRRWNRAAKADISAEFEALRQRPAMAVAHWRQVRR